MKVQTFEDLIKWTHALHEQLAQCLAHCATTNEEQRAQWLLGYLAEHEARIGGMVDEFRKRADPKALNTWIYDYLNHEPIEPHRHCDAPYASMNFDQIFQSVFDLHNQTIIGLYRDLLSKADIPEAYELMQELLDMEEHETMQLAQQVNRSRDM